MGGRLRHHSQRPQDTENGTQNQSLRRHALAVEATTRALARSAGVSDESEVETWGRVGLIHDFDYERYPTVEEHVGRGMEILRAPGWPEALVRAVGGHAFYTGIARATPLETLTSVIAARTRIEWSQGHRSLSQRLALPTHRDDRGEGCQDQDGHRDRPRDENRRIPSRHGQGPAEVRLHHAPEDLG